MLKLGRLVNSRGRYQGRQIVPQDWISRMQRPYLASALSFMDMKGGEVGYGY